MSTFITQQSLAATCSSDRIDLVARAATTQIFHTAWNASNGWQPQWDLLGDSFASVGPALVSASSRDLVTFGLDNSTHEVLYSSWSNGDLDPTWGTLSGQEFSSPLTVVSSGPDRLDVLGVGTDRAMYHQAWDGNWQSKWENRGGSLASSLAATSWSTNRLDVFGLGSDAAEMYHMGYDDGWLGSWESIGGPKGGFAGDPAVSAWSPNRLDVVSVGGDNAMYHTAWNGSAWDSEWKNLAGGFTSSPAIVSWGPNRLDIFGLGWGDQSIWHSWYDGDTSGWYEESDSGIGWESLGGGPFGAPPVLVSRGLDMLDIFAVSETNNTIYQLSYDGAWSDWTSLGEPIYTLPTPSASSHDNDREKEKPDKADNHGVAIGVGVGVGVICLLIAGIIGACLLRPSLRKRAFKSGAAPAEIEARSIVRSDEKRTPLPSPPMYEQKGPVQGMNHYFNELEVNPGGSGAHVELEVTPCWGKYNVEMDGKGNIAELG